MPYRPDSQLITLPYSAPVSDRTQSGYVFPDEIVKNQPPRSKLLPPSTTTTTPQTAAKRSQPSKKA
jgi:hypothetical protein